MLLSQAESLTKHGKELLSRAGASSNRDAQRLTETALACFAQAREIFRERRSNSILLFCEICLTIERKPSYPLFLAFCTRNALEIVSEDDFKEVVAAISKTSQSQPAPILDAS